jgi:hypothetical protein
MAISRKNERPLEEGELLRLARETIDAVPTCFAITIDREGDASARAVNPS